MQSIENMCRNYINDVYSYLICITHNKDIAEELTQETMYKAIKNLRNYRGDCKMNIWLCKIAKNEWFMYLKKNKKISTVSLSDIKSISLDINIEDEIVDELIENSRRKQIYELINKLDYETSQIMYLRLENDMSFLEIGEIFDKTERWARVKFFRGKEKIKEMIRNDESKERV